MTLNKSIFKLMVVHYAEIGLKGKIRPFFEDKLCYRIKYALNGLPLSWVKRIFGRIIIQYQSELSNSELNEAQKRLSRVFGIANISPALIVPTDLKGIEKFMLAALEGSSFQTFGIKAKRSDKAIPFTSQDAACQLGAAIVNHYNKKVNLTAPDLWIYVEIMFRETLIYFNKVEGSGGLPLGTGKKVAVMLSGGIDSPVAAYMMMRRGCPPLFIHFHSFPYTDETSIGKVKELTNELCQFRCQSKLILVPFAEIQQKIITDTAPSFRVLLYRRLMFRIAEDLARQEKALAIVTGENLGQVASQTLENIGAIQSVLSIPILRPLIGFDKDEIVKLAGKINTYYISTQPHADCCSYLAPSKPAIRATDKELDVQESFIPVQELIQSAIKQSESFIFCKE